MKLKSVNIEQTSKLKMVEKNINENKMREIKLDKVVLNIAVGNDEARLIKAMKLLEVITGRKPTKTLAKKRIATWKIRPGLPIGCKVTLRREKAKELLDRLLSAKDRKLFKKQFGNETFSFGIKEYIQIPSVPYQRDIGLMGLDVSVSFKRPGYRVKERKIKKGKIPKRHRITKQEIIDYVQKNFNVVIE